MTIQAKFGGRCGRCGQRFEAGTQIEWVRGIGGGTATSHANALECKQAVDSAAAKPKVEFDGKPIANFLLAARSRGLKFPKVHFLAPGGGELELYIAGPQSAAPGSIQVKLAGRWIGRIQPDGVVYGPLTDREKPVLDALHVIAADPAKAAKEYGMLTGRCSFCNTGLTDEGSIEVGYGPVCAKRWGLPHTPKGSPALTQAIA